MARAIEALFPVPGLHIQTETRFFIRAPSKKKLDDCCSLYSDAALLAQQSLGPLHAQRRLLRLVVVLTDVENCSQLLCQINTKTEMIQVFIPSSRAKATTESLARLRQVARAMLGLGPLALSKADYRDEILHAEDVVLLPWELLIHPKRLLGSQLNNAQALLATMIATLNANIVFPICDALVAQIHATLTLIQTAKTRLSANTSLPLSESVAILAEVTASLHTLQAAYVVVPEYSWYPDSSWAMWLPISVPLLLKLIQPARRSLQALRQV